MCLLFGPGYYHECVPPVTAGGDRIAGNTDRRTVVDPRPALTPVSIVLAGLSFWHFKAWLMILGQGLIICTAAAMIYLQTFA